MKSVYQADNTVNAHVVKNLLENEGIPAHVRGEFLQSATGFLPATDMVHVEVDDEHFEQARALVLDWESAQPEFDDVEQEERIEPSIAAPPPRRGWFLPALCGLLVGVAATSFYYHTPTSYDGIDYDGDGELDERWTFVHGQITKLEQDRNLDGKIDRVETYDRHALIEAAVSDEDYDGRMDSETRYSEGMAIWSKSDLTGDGFKNYLLHFSNGAPTKGIYISPRSKLPVKVEHFGPLGMVSRAELDTDGDGKLDTIHEYDEIGEIASTGPS